MSAERHDDPHAAIRAQAERFNAELPALLAGPGAGRWCVYRDGVQHLADDQDAALAWAFEAFGLAGGFLVVRIEPRPPPLPLHALGSAGAAVVMERLRALEAAARALVAALPRCDHCERPALRAFARGGARYCDAHGRNVQRILWDPAACAPRFEVHEAPEYPRAPALRALCALLEGESR